MNKITLTTALAILISGCANAPPNTPGAGSGQTYTPIIDMQGVDPARYSNDLTACRSYAGNVDAQGEALSGAIGGAILMGAMSAMLGGNRNMNNQSMSAGGLVGVTAKGNQAIGKQERIIINCMTQRGYRTLDGAMAAPVIYAPQPYNIAPVDATSSNAVSPYYANQTFTPSPPKPAALGKDAIQAEKFAVAKTCHPAPQVTLATKGAGFEVYSVICTSGDTLMIRCEFGNCRAVQ